MVPLFIKRELKKRNNHWYRNGHTFLEIDKIMNIIERMWLGKRKACAVWVKAAFTEVPMDDSHRYSQYILIKDKEEGDLIYYKLGKHTIILPRGYFTEIPNYIYINNISVFSNKLLRETTSKE